MRSHEKVLEHESNPFSILTYRSVVRDFQEVLTQLEESESSSSSVARIEETKIVRGRKEVEKAVYQFLDGANKTFLHALSDERIPKDTTLTMQVISSLFSVNPNFSFHLITDLQRNNLEYHKQLMSAGVKIRHSEGNKVSFAVSKDEYIAVPLNVLEQQIASGEEIPDEIVWSKRQDLVLQADQIFQSMWRVAIPAEERMREIEEGRPRYETKIIRDPSEILAETKRMALTSKKYSVSSVSGGLLYAYNYALEDFKSILEKNRTGEHEGIRWITHIDGSCVNVAKKFSELGMIIRDVPNIPTESFGFSEKEVGVTVSRLEGGQLNSSALFSNDPMYVGHYSSVFQVLWENGEDADKRIREIESGVAEPELKIIRNPTEIEALYLRLIREAKEEIWLILPSTNTYLRELKIGVIDEMRFAASQRNVRVRLLSPESLDQNDLKDDQSMEIRSIRNVSAPNTVTALLVDQSVSLMIELQDDSKSDFVEAIGPATYSTRGSIVRANVRFFERLWEAEVLLEKEKRSRKEAELLRDILTHDIRNYNQTARMGTEFLLEHIRGQTELEAISKTVIEAIDGSTTLVDKANKLGMILSRGERTVRPLNLIDSIDRSLLVVKAGYPTKMIKETRKISSLEGSPPNEIVVMADDFIDEIFVNLFTNAVKFTPRPNVSLDISIEETKASNESNAFWQVTIADSGRGIPTRDINSIFQRYSESYKGSGLGLSIVQALVESYGGEVSARNRTDGTTGAVFDVKLRKKG
jgi:signal transduction histidine kinase